MPDTWQDTAKRLAAHPRFTFLEGMLVTNGNHTFRIGPFSGKPPGKGKGGRPTSGGGR